MFNVELRIVNSFSLYEVWQSQGEQWGVDGCPPNEIRSKPQKGVILLLCLKHPYGYK